MNEELMEKVIKAMECCAVGAECDHCPYSSMNKSGHEGCYQMHIDALALLKAQEPVEPVYELGITRCGQCNHEIDKYGGDNYCPQCGRAVKWE